MRDVLNTILESFRHLTPELVLIAGMLIILTASLIAPRNRRLINFMTSLTFLSGSVMCFAELGEHQLLFGGLMRKEGLSGFLKMLVDVSGFLTTILILDGERIARYRGEFGVLLLAAATGGHFLLMSNSLLMVFLSLEIVSLPSYMLVTFSFSRAGSEGSLKYFFFGAISSAAMLYGFTVLYGVTGTLDFTSEEFARGFSRAGSFIVLIAAVLALTGYLFKIAAVPLHPWVPDVYQAAPFPVVAFLSTAPKLAGIGAVMKFFISLHLFAGEAIDWQAVVAVVAMVTITVGNVAALSQKTPKRLMAWSSIAQSGFLLVGIAAFVEQGLQYMLFYAGVYVIMNFAVFASLSFFDRKGINTISDFGGSGREYVFVSVLLLVGLISLTGLPPTGGFTGKVFIFSSLWQSYELSGKEVLLWLVITGILNTVISLFYYIRIPYYAFIRAAQTPEKHGLPAAGWRPSYKNFADRENLLALILVLFILALFFVPGLLMGLINKVKFVF